ncbi:nitroreductase family protein [Natranaerofaba carboxydovora]|uniref:nitroreductase family protein n=1 Tax=Natranaerofaba carboxydovora TaxID=2742683 RepID=UPI001F144281|nr:nitroreductase family protein [Natranaerofaba carboxydovora]UMZ73666.1 Putative TM nitroreductase [Natranaerofaba carboxydovora]
MDIKFFNKDITEVIKKRSSIRTYKPVALSEEVESDLKNYSNSIESPFSSEVRFVFLNDDSFVKETGGKIGTYGVIKGAKNFVTGVVKEDEAYSLLNLGYTLEKLILYATSLGLGTCWLGGTFNIKGLDKLTGLKENEFLPIITPIGYPDTKKSMIDKIMKTAAGSKKRKSWEKLFFNNSINSPITKEKAGYYETPLEMVRLAPSASNFQPWRIIKENNNWHFFMEYSKVVNKAIGFDIQKIDMGIAMCHFELSALEKGLNGQWIINDKLDITCFEGINNLQYIATWEEHGS